MYHDSSYLLLPLTLDNSNTQKVELYTNLSFCGQDYEREKGPRYISNIVT